MKLNSMITNLHLYRPTVKLNYFFNLPSILSGLDKVLLIHFDTNTPLKKWTFKLIQVYKYIKKAKTKYFPKMM